MVACGIYSVSQVQSDSGRKASVCSPSLMTSATESLMRMAPMGKPLARGLAMVKMSGWQSVGNKACAHNLPVRPRPHYIRKKKKGFNLKRGLEGMNAKLT